MSKFLQATNLTRSESTATSFFKTVRLYTVKITLCTYNYNILLLLIAYVLRPPSIPTYSLQNICVTNDHGYVPFVEVTKLM
jgi:hypothetical protein